MSLLLINLHILWKIDVIVNIFNLL